MNSKENTIGVEFLVASGFSIDVVRMFEKHSSSLVKIGRDLDKKDEQRRKNRLLNSPPKGGLLLVSTVN